MLQRLTFAFGVLAVLAVAVAPARASITPPGGTFTAVSSSSAITENFGTRQSIRCDQIEISGRVSADGRSISGTIRFGRTGGPGCSHSFLGPMTIQCPGSLTWSSTSSVAGTSASFSLSLDSGFSCTFTAVGFRRDIAGPQAVGGCVTASQGPPTRLQVNCTFPIVQGGTLSVTAALQSNRALTVS